MKTTKKIIYLKVEVPEGYSLSYPIIVCSNHDMNIQGSAVTTEIHLPTEEEIRTQAQSEYRSWESWAKFIAGANWYRNKILKQIL